MVNYISVEKTFGDLECLRQEIISKDLTYSQTTELLKMVLQIEHDVDAIIRNYALEDDIGDTGLGERPKGEWIAKSGKIAPSGFGTYICSRCGTGIRGIKSKMPYCTCGAKMN